MFEPLVRREPDNTCQHLSKVKTRVIFEEKIKVWCFIRDLRV